MGSFNMGCGISNLTINPGDEVGFILLNPATTSKSRHRPDDAGRAFYIYATDSHKPYLPPIFGKYDDYGYVAEITPSVTTKLLEEQYGTPIENILKCVTDMRGFYDSFGKIFEDYSTLAQHKFSYSEREDFFRVLTEAGFESNANSNPKVYTFKQFTLATEDNLNWLLFKTENPDKGGLKITARDAFDLLGEFHSKTLLLPGYPEELWSTVQALHDHSGMYFLKEVYHTMKVFVSQEETYSDKAYQVELVEAYDQWVEIFSELTEEEKEKALYSALLQFQSSLVRAFEFPYEQIPKLIAYKDNVPELMDWFSLSDVMTTVNRMFQPSFNGEQFGNDEASAALNKITDKILAERSVDREDWDEFDEVLDEATTLEEK